MSAIILFMYLLKSCLFSRSLSAVGLAFPPSPRRSHGAGTSRGVSGFPRGYISPNFKVLTSNIPAREHRKYSWTTKALLTVEWWGWHTHSVRWTAAVGKLGGCDRTSL